MSVYRQNLSVRRPLKSEVSLLHPEVETPLRIQSRQSTSSSKIRGLMTSVNAWAPSFTKRFCFPPPGHILHEDQVDRKRDREETVQAKGSRKGAAWRSEGSTGESQLPARCFLLEPWRLNGNASVFFHSSSEAFAGPDHARYGCESADFLRDYPFCLIDSSGSKSPMVRHVLIDKQSPPVLTCVATRSKDNDCRA